MTKKEIQAELIQRIKHCDKILFDSNESSYEQTFAEGRYSGLKLALQLVEHLDEGKKA